MRPTVAQALVRLLREELAEARRRAGRRVLVHVQTDPLVPAPSSGSWWDVPVAAVSRLDSTRPARKSYEAAKAGQRTYWNEAGAQ